jgi:hypothetical protein
MMSLLGKNEVLLLVGWIIRDMSCTLWGERVVDDRRHHTIICWELVKIRHRLHAG